MARRALLLLLDRAEQLTPRCIARDAVRRAVDAAYLHFEAGDSRRAEAKLRDVVAPSRRGGFAPNSCFSRASGCTERPDEAKALFSRVLDEAGDDRQTLGIAHEGVAACSIWVFERFEEALEHTRSPWPWQRARRRRARSRHDHRDSARRRCSVVARRPRPQSGRWRFGTLLKTFASWISR